MQIEFGEFDYRNIFKDIKPLGYAGICYYTNKSLLSSFRNILDREIKHGKIKHYKLPNQIHLGYMKNRSDSVRQACEIGYFSVGQLRLEISVAKKDLYQIEILQKNHITFDPPIVRKKKELKTRIKVIFDIKNIKIDANKSLINLFDFEKCSCPTKMLWCKKIGSAADPFIAFQCLICGKEYHCSCFKKSYEVYVKNHINKSEIHSIVKRIIYKEKICHICKGIPSEHSLYFGKGHSTQFRSDYHYYIHMEALKDPKYYFAFEDQAILDPHKYLYDIYKEAENRVRDRLGIHHVGLGWTSEAQLYYITKSLFPNEPVIHQASPDWLNSMRFDIYLPKKKIAIEYQGQQHYEPIDFFGGEDGYLDTIERDQRKLKLAEKNGVKIVYIKYTQAITRELVSSLIKKSYARCGEGFRYRNKSSQVLNKNYALFEHKETTIL